MNLEKCERCLEIAPLVAAVRSDVISIQVCLPCAFAAEKLANAPGDLGAIRVEWIENGIRKAKGE